MTIVIDDNSSLRFDRMHMIVYSATAEFFLCEESLYFFSPILDRHKIGR